MDKKEFDTMTYLLYESDMARCERIIKRQWLLCILLGIGNVISLILWILA